LGLPIKWALVIALKVSCHWDPGRSLSKKSSDTDW